MSSRGQGDWVQSAYVPVSLRSCSPVEKSAFWCCSLCGSSSSGIALCHSHPRFPESRNTSPRNASPRNTSRTSAQPAALYINGVA
jgi:hypothetical protein